MRLSFSNGGFQTSTLMFIGTEGVLRRPLTYDNHPFMYSSQKDKKAKREKGEMTEREKEGMIKRQNDCY